MINEKLSFQFVTENQVREAIMNLDVTKALRIGNISLGFLKTTVDIHLLFITNSINISIEKCCFKHAEVTSILKKKDD